LAIIHYYFYAFKFYAFKVFLPFQSNFP